MKKKTDNKNDKRETILKKIANVLWCKHYAFTHIKLSGSITSFYTWREVKTNHSQAYPSWHSCNLAKKICNVPSAESSRSVRGLGKGVSDKPYPRLCNARRPRLEPGTFWSQAVRLYRLHQARPSVNLLSQQKKSSWYQLSGQAKSILQAPT